jgi:lipopolysaccharide biosynthesis glycosyltransferase
MDAYYNSGVLLMNLEAQRKRVDEREIFDFVEKNRVKLLMPDQDALNALYAKEIKSVDPRIYNYDARCYKYYKLVSEGLYDLDYVIGNTIFLHFCGKRKPWKKNYKGKFASLYAYFKHLALC